MCGALPGIAGIPLPTIPPATSIRTGGSRKRNGNATYALSFATVVSFEIRSSMSTCDASRGSVTVVRIVRAPSAGDSNARTSAVARDARRTGTAARARLRLPMSSRRSVASRRLEAWLNRPADAYRSYT